MGDILASFGLAGSQQPPAGVVLPNTAGVTEGVMGFPPIERSGSGPITTPPIVAPAGGESEGVDEAVTVNAENWKPRKPTILGALADAFLMSKGGKPMYSIMRDQRSVNEALQGYQSNPEAAIRRLMKIPGMESKALDLLNQMQDNKRADLQAQSLAEERADKARMRVGGYLGAVGRAKDPNAAYQRALPMLRRMLESRGADPSELPDQYDEGLADTLFYGGMTPDQQIDNDRDAEYKERRLGQMDETIENRSRYQDERLDQIDRTISERERHNEVMEAIATDREQRLGSETSPRVLNTPNGLMELSPSGMTGRIGDQVWQKVKMDGKISQWKRVK